jgi:hypothetical protein
MNNEERKQKRKEYLQRPEVKAKYKITIQKWKKDNPEKVKKSLRKWYQTHKERVRKVSQEQRKILENLIGNSCVVCGSTRYIQFHEIHNKKHPITFSYYFKHIKDFVPLCQRCHTTKTRLNQLTEPQRTALVNL